MGVEDYINIIFAANADGSPKTHGTFTARVRHCVSLPSNQEGTAPEYDYNRYDEGTYTFHGKEFTFTITQSKAQFSDDDSPRRDVPMSKLPVVVATAYDAATRTVQYPDYDTPDSGTIFQGYAEANVSARVQ